VPLPVYMPMQMPSLSRRHFAIRPL
jgi:hypothetical protein